MATREELEILLKAQDQTRAAFDSVQKTNEKLAQQVEKLNGSVSSAGENAVATGAKFGVGFTVATQAAEKLLNGVVAAAQAVAKLAEKAEQIQNKAAITGFSTDSVQALERLSTNAGVSSDKVFAAISRMQRAAVDGKKGFTDLGLEGQKFLQLMPEDQLQAVAERIMAFPTAAERAAAAMNLFGRSGAELLPILDDIAKGSEELQVSLSEEQVAALAKLDDSLGRAKGAFADLGEQILATIATSPDAAQAIDDIATAVSWMALQVKEAQPALQLYVALLGRLAGLAGPNSPLGALRLVGLATERGPKPATPTGFGVEAPSGMPAGPSIAEQYAEKALFAQLARDDKRVKSAQKAVAELDRLEARHTAEVIKAEVAETASLERLDAAAAAHTRRMIELDEAEQKADQKRIDDEQRASERANAEEMRRLAEMERQNQRYVQSLRAIGDALTEGGEAVGGFFGTVLSLGGAAIQVFANLKDKALQAATTTEKLAVALEGAANAYKSGSFLGGAASGAAAGAAFGGIGALIGGAVGGILGLFGSGQKKREEEARKREEEARKAAEALHARIEAIGSSIDGVNRMTDIWYQRLLKVGEAGAADAAQFERLGLYALSAFQGLVKETGDVWAALQKLAPSLDQLIEAQARFGFQTSAATQKLLDLYAKASANEDAMNSLSALNQIMKGFEDAAIRSQELFAAFGADAVAVFDELIAGGLGSGEAMALMQPTLQRLWEQQEKFGYATDEATQKLLDEAEAAGLVGDQFKDVNERILDALMEGLGAIIEAVGGKLPEAWRKAAQAVGEYGDAAGRVPGAPGGGGGGGRESEAPPEQRYGGIVLPFVPRAASGIIASPSSSGTLVRMAEAGKAELAAPVEDMLKVMTRTAMEAAGGGGGDVHVYIGGREIDDYVVKRERAGFLKKKR